MLFPTQGPRWAFLFTLDTGLAALDTIEIIRSKGDARLKKLRRVDQFHILRDKRCDRFDSKVETELTLVHYFENDWLLPENCQIDWGFGDYTDRREGFEKKSKLETLYRWLLKERRALGRQTGLKEVSV